MKVLMLWMLLQSGLAQAAPPPGSDAGTVATESVVGTTMSASGRWRVEVRSAAVPLRRGVQRFTVQVTEFTSGRPMASGTLRVEPWMPTMGHGIQETPRVVSRGPGLFEVSDLDLFMPGVWELRFTLEGTPPDTAKVTLKLGR